MFQFRRFPSYSYEFTVRCMNVNHADCSIRTSAAHSVLTAPRSFSQLTTSFFGSWCQGIHPALFFTLPFCEWICVLIKNCSILPDSKNYYFSCRFTRSFLNLLCYLYSVFKLLCFWFLKNRCQLIIFIYQFISAFDGGHKWTRTIDLTLIRRAL